MSSKIDERVVEMRFDNKQFERNVQTTMGSLDKLKSSLNMEGAAKSFDEIDKASRKINLSGLGSAVETVHEKFSALEVVAITALANITNSAVNAGKNLVKSLSIDQVTSGFQEYEMKMKSVQTIMSSTGEDIETVSKYLNDLNAYSDKTIYSFADMTNNIGKFTNAGVKLDDAVTAIQGICNEAAVSGATAEEASRAMYNFSQALSAGYVQKIDWRSIENANMATADFKERLLETAVALGTVEKSSDGMYRALGTNNAGKAMKEAVGVQEAFIDGLQYQWLTSEVLTETLKDYADETTNIGKKAFAAAKDVKTFTDLLGTTKEAIGSGWAASFEIIFGNLEEAKKMWTGFSDVISNYVNKQAAARNAILQDWKDLGGRTELINAVYKAFEALGSILKPIKEAFREIFPAMTGKRLYEITVGLKNLMERMKISDSTAQKLKNTFKGLFSIINIIKQVFSAAFKAVTSLVGGMSGLGKGLLTITGGMGEGLTKFSEFLAEGDVFNKIFGKIADVIHSVIGAITDFIKWVSSKFSFPSFEEFKETMSDIGDGAVTVKDKVCSAFSAVGEWVQNSGLLSGLQKVWNGIKTVVKGIADVVKHVGSTLFDGFKNATFNDFLDMLNGIATGGVAIGIAKFTGVFKKFTKIFEMFTKHAKSIKDSVCGVLDSVRGCFEAYQTQLKANALLKIAGAIGILALSIVTLSMIDSVKLSISIGALTALFGELMGSMAIFNKINEYAEGSIKNTICMMGFATSLVILGSVLKKLSDLEPKQLAVAVTGMTVLMGEMLGAMAIMGKMQKSGYVSKSTGQMILIAAALKVLASACSDLAEMDWNELAKGLTATGILMGEMIAFMKLTADCEKDGALETIGIVWSLSSALKKLATVCEKFAQMSWEQLAKGLGSITILLGELTAFAKLTASTKDSTIDFASVGAGLILISVSMKVFASAIGQMASLSWEGIAKGLIVTAESLGMVAAATKLMPEHLSNTGAGLLIISASLVVLAGAVKIMGSMSWESVAKGLIVLGGSLGALSGALYFMDKYKKGSKALLVVAAAIMVLAPAMKILGSMSWEEIAKGMVTLAATFGILGAAGYILEPIVPTILGLSKALALIGVSVLAVGAGLVMAGMGLSALAVGFTALAGAGIAGAAAVATSLKLIIEGIAECIPIIAKNIGEGIIELCHVISDHANDIGQTVKDLLLSFVPVLVEVVPEYVKGLLEMIEQVLDALIEHGPSIVSKVFKFLVGILHGVAENLPELIKEAMNVVMAFFSGIADGIKSVDMGSLLDAVEGFGIISALMFVFSSVAALIPSAMVGVLGIGAVIAEIALVLAAIGALKQIPGLQWLIDEGGDLLESVGKAIGKFIGGIVGGFMSGVSSQFPQIGSDLAGFMTNVQPFIDGAKSIDPSVLDGAKALAEVILLLTAADILDSLTSWLTGGNSLTEFAEQLVPFGKAMMAFSEEIAGIDGEVVANAAIAGKTLAEMADTLPNNGGAFSWLVGDNELDEFGERLIPFAKSMKRFANEIAGIDCDVVTNAATAGKALTELADTVPNTGGVVSWFTGNNDLDDFGARIVSFGKAMMAFAKEVEGLNADVITNSATAGKALTELADTVPNTGGVVSWFTGNNDLDDFGARIVPFGKALKEYSLTIADLDGEVIKNSANAAGALVELANSLPEDGGIFSIFGDQDDIASFGEKLTSFGNSFKEYYNSMDGVNVETLDGVIAAFHSLVDLANGIADADVDELTSFSEQLAEMGSTGITDFINAFSEADERIQTAASGMVSSFAAGVDAETANLKTKFTNLVDGVLTACRTKKEEFKTLGSEVITQFLAGAKGKDVSVRTTFMQLMNTSLTAIRNKYSEFVTTGQNAVNNLVSGIHSKISNASDKFVDMVNSCVKAVRDKFDDFKEAGRYLVEGLNEGIEDYISRAEQSSKKMAHAAAEAARKELDEHSPSKVGKEIGGYFGEGFVIAINDYADNSYKAGSSMAAAAKEGLANAIAKINDFISSDMDMQPTIRPVLDLSDIRSNASELSALLSRNQAGKISASLNYAANAENDKNVQSQAAAGNTYSFVQNNYSPKALSSIDIYRQTKNQFSMLKGLV